MRGDGVERDGERREREGGRSAQGSRVMLPAPAGPRGRETKIPNNEEGRAERPISIIFPVLD